MLFKPIWLRRDPFEGHIVFPPHKYRKWVRRLELSIVWSLPRPGYDDRRSSHVGAQASPVDTKVGGWRADLTLLRALKVGVVVWTGPDIAQKK